MSVDVLFAHSGAPRTCGVVADVCAGGVHTRQHSSNEIVVADRCGGGTSASHTLVTSSVFPQVPGLLEEGFWNNFRGKKPLSP